MMQFRRFGCLLATLVLAAPVMAGEDFSGKDLSGYIGTSKTLDESNFEDAVLKAAKFDGASLKKADFRNADLTDVTFDNADLSESRASGFWVVSRKNNLPESANRARPEELVIRR